MQSTPPDPMEEEAAAAADITGDGERPQKGKEDHGVEAPVSGGSSGHVPFAEVADAAVRRDELGSPGADADRNRGTGQG